MLKDPILSSFLSSVRFPLTTKPLVGYEHDILDSLQKFTLG